MVLQISPRKSVGIEGANNCHCQSSKINRKQMTCVFLSTVLKQWCSPGATRGNGIIYHCFLIKLPLYHCFLKAITVLPVWQKNRNALWLIRFYRYLTANFRTTSLFLNLAVLDYPTHCDNCVFWLCSASVLVAVHTAYCTLQIIRLTLHYAAEALPRQIHLLVWFGD